MGWRFPRGAGLGAAALLAATALGGGEVRQPPARPGQAAPPAPPRPAAGGRPAGVEIAGREYVPVVAALRSLGLGTTAAAGGRRLNFTDRAGHAGTLEADSREIFWTGLRIFLGRPVLVRGGQLYLARRDFDVVLVPRCRPDFGRARRVPHVIVIDAGHGGIDNGTENAKLGLREKFLTLDVARRLQPLLQSAGYEVILTRNRDAELRRDKRADLDRRAEIANRAHADLFLSIHFNAVANDPRVHGTEVFTYAPAGQPSTDSGGHGNDDSSAAVVAAGSNDHWNGVLAHAVHGELLHVLQTEDRGEKVAHFRVLQSLDCPAVLVEPAIISNEPEGRRVATPRFRQLVAEALALGVRRYALLIAAQPSATIEASSGTAGRLKSSPP